VAATKVPQTRELSGDDAWEVLRRVHYLPLLRKSLQRFRDADGYSYARGIGFQVVLASLPALIFFMAVAVWTRSELLRSSVEGVVGAISPGPSTDILQQAVEQGEGGARGNVWAMTLGGLTALVSGAVGMSQFQQGAGRLYGEDEDRPFASRYALSLVLAFSVGLLFAAGFVAIAFGDPISDALDLGMVWAWTRWPLGAVAVAVAITAMYKVGPKRDQPSLSWLIVGGITATVLWVLFSVAMALYLNVSSTFGETYGPLAGLIGFLIWAQLSGIAVLAGMAFAAQLEKERAGMSGLESDDSAMATS
jgi:YihY family inner membrane protein